MVLAICEFIRQLYGDLPTAPLTARTVLSPVVKVAALVVSGR